MRAAFLATFGVAGALIVLALGALLVLLVLEAGKGLYDFVRTRRGFAWYRFDFAVRAGAQLHLNMDQRSIRSIWWDPHLMLPTGRNAAGTVYERFRPGDRAEAVIVHNGWDMTERVFFRRLP